MLVNGYLEVDALLVVIDYNKVVSDFQGKSILTSNN